jgi:uncharacterized protein (TIGR03435 family)
MTARDAGINFRGDLFEVEAATVGDILDMLGGFQLFRVVGGPDCMRIDRYDLEAKADGPLEVADRQQAVMALLTERFQLVSHRERREMPGTVLRASRKPAGLKQASSNDSYSIRTVNSDVLIYGRADVFCNELSVTNVEAPVVDETELKGAYNSGHPLRRGGGAALPGSPAPAHNRNRRWHGPFQTLAAANKSAQATGLPSWQHQCVR